jgi:hypothetical protein
MATNFTIKTYDNNYSYVAETADENATVNVVFSPQNNNVSADTQGYQRKVQVGRNRCQAKVIVALSQNEYENTFMPMLVHPAYLIVTFDRNIPLRTSTTGNFVMEKLKIKQELPDNVYEIEFILTEVLNATETS